MSTSPVLPNSHPAQRPSWVSEKEFRTAVEEVVEAASEQYTDHAWRALCMGEHGDPVWWAERLAKAVLTTDEQVRHEIKKELEKRIAEYAEAFCNAWTDEAWEDWQIAHDHDAAEEVSYEDDGSDKQRAEHYDSVRSHNLMAAWGKR